MNNIQFNTNNLVQNSAEYKLILSRFASQLYDLSRYNQPVLILATLVVLLVFTLIVYYFDAKKLKKAENLKNEQNQVETKETVDKVESTVNTNDISEPIQEKANNLESNENLLSNLNSIKDEIIELRKELEILQYNKISTEDSDSEEKQEVAEDDEDVNKANYSKSESESESESQSADNDNDKTNNSKTNNKTNIQKLISNMSTTEIEEVLQTCSNYVLIPNWYTKEDFEGLSNNNLSSRTWNKILSNCDEYSSLIDETNAMMVGWFENSVSSKIDKIPYNISSIEESDSDSESDEEETKLLEEDSDSESDDDDDSQSDESDSDDKPVSESVDKKPSIFIIKQLEKFKYSQLKKIAGVTNNKLNKKELIELITKDYKKYSILNALNMFV